MAKRIVINELNKKKDELSRFISKLENIIKQKEKEIFHIESTISIFKDDSQNYNDKSKEETNPNIIKHNFKTTEDNEPDNKANQNIVNAINEQKRQLIKSSINEKEALKQFKELIRS